MKAAKPLLAAVFLVAGCVGTAVAGEGADDAGLDALFVQLAAAPDEESAQLLEEEIWQVWTRHDDPAVQDLMDRALQYLRFGEPAAALPVLDQLVALAPDYAEGWNQRATAYFLLGEDERALFDIAEALVREPRHFGALAGRGLIRLRQGRTALAYQNIVTAMKIHPYLRERELLPPFLRGEAPAPWDEPPTRQ